MSKRTKKYLQRRIDKKVSDWCDRIAAAAEDEFIKSIDDMSWAMQEYYSTIYYDKTK